MKKKLVAAIASVCLVAALGVGATLAYYTSVSDAAVNTFTVGNVKIDLLEPEWDSEEGKNLMPGAEVSKNPYIVNTGASAGYMMLKVSGMEEMAEMGFTVKTGETDGYNHEKWTLVDENGAVLQAPADHALVDGYYIYNAGAVDAKAQTEPLFTAVVFDENVEESVGTTYQVVAKYQDAKGYFTYKDVNGKVIPENADRTPVMDSEGKVILRYFVEGDVADEASTGFDTYEAAAQHVLDNHQEEASFAFNLTVQGYAIQAENVEFEVGGVYSWVTELIGKA